MNVTKKIVIIYCFFSTWNLFSQDLAQKLSDLEAALKNLTQALQGEATSHEPPPPPPPVEKDKPTLQSPQTAFNEKFEKKKAIATEELTESRSKLQLSTGTPIDYFYYGIVQQNVSHYGGRLVFYVPEVKPGTTVGEFFSHEGKLTYPEKNKVSDTFVPFVLYNPMQDKANEQNEKSSLDANTKLSGMISEIEKNVDALVGDYAQIETSSKNKKNKYELGTNDAKVLNGHIKNISDKLSAVVPTIQFINQSNLDKLKKCSQKFSAFLKTFNDNKNASNANLIDLKKKSSGSYAYKNAQASFDTSYGIFTFNEAVDNAFKLIDSKHHYIIIHENPHAKKLYEGLLKKPEVINPTVPKSKISQTDISTMRTQKSDLDDIEKGRKLKSDNTQYSDDLKKLIASFDGFMDRAEYELAWNKYVDIQTKIQEEESSGWEE